MNFFRSNLTHYIILALRESGVHIEGDMYMEIDQAFTDLEDTLKNMAARIKILEADKEISDRVANESNPDFNGY